MGRNGKKRETPSRNGKKQEKRKEREETGKIERKGRHRKK